MLSKIIDFFFPVTCIRCGKVGRWVCSSCSRSLTNSIPECYVCRRVSNRFATHNSCSLEIDILPELSKSSITRTVPTIQTTDSTVHIGLIKYPKSLKVPRSAIILWKYNQTARKLMRAFKYQSQYSIRDALYQLISDRCKQIFQFEDSMVDSLLVPIPLHKYRIRERGFNQAEIICQCLIRYLKNEQNVDTDRLPSTLDLLYKKINNQHQSHADHTNRTANVVGSFATNPRLIPILSQINKIVIVDDVITTGSTINEAINTITSEYHALSLPLPEINIFALFRGRPYFVTKV